ncbi:MAG: AI-2E family transporter [Candidatus Roizmanbacteria bacterium]|nr:AI-2E family transporter [Candidatus Roizmanbacteria bacterium]
MQKIEISSKTIIFTVGFILLLGVIWLIKDLIFSLFIAFIIAGALRQPVDFLEKKKIPRVLASFVIYLLFLFAIVNLFALVIPPLLKEISFLFKNLPEIIKTALPQISSYVDLSTLTQNLPNLANDVINLIKGIFSNAIFVTSTLFFGFYLLLEKDFIENVLVNFFDEAEAKKIAHIVNRGQKRAGSWFWGEVVLMTAVGALTYIGLTIIGMKYALALAVLAGLLEVVPTLGPIISAIPAALIGFSSSYVLGLSNIALYFIVQQLENNLLVPLVMKKIVGVHPIITLMALIIGGKLAGVLGVLLAVPTTIFIETILIEWQKKAQ